MNMLLKYNIYFTINILKRYYRKNNIMITEESINRFNIKDELNNVLSRSDNDKSNKIREDIIYKILNKKIPEEYYKNKKWYNLRINLHDILYKINNNKDYKKIECEKKAGRRFNYDFKINIYNNDNNNKYNIEFKFNSKCIKDTPQFSSPMYPSRYLDKSYEEYYYDNYLIKMNKEKNINIPERNIYLSSIHNNKPECLIDLQKKYYEGCKRSSKYTGDKDAIEFYKYMNSISKSSIKKFIMESNLDIKKLSKYLYSTQNNKKYLLYKDGKFYYEVLDNKNYNILSYKKMKNYYECITESGYKLKVLLRWKNGNGIAYPAFQISIKK